MRYDHAPWQIALSGDVGVTDSARGRAAQFSTGKFSMIDYTDSQAGIEPAQLDGFFVGWPHPPSPETHFHLLSGSDHVVLAIDLERSQVIGIVTALTDGVLSSLIPLLEVLPAYQSRGIGTALMTRMFDRLGHLPNVDLLCDPDVVPFYERLGMRPCGGMVLPRPKG
jgi:GNAT superfamily N-acetyltransferase